MIPILWVISMLTSFWFFFRLRVWTEHVGLKEGETLRFTPTFIERMLFLPHNTEYHYEHHESPGVSFDKLPELRKEKFPKLKDII
jgi:fatty acid desaturase